MPEAPDQSERMSGDRQKLLSVVVIGLNEGARLKESLEAIFAERPMGYALEVIYVDSGSTDRSLEIAGAMAGVQVLHLEGKPSAARARNLGLRRAHGCYVQLVDGDSVLQPGWLQTALQILDDRPEISCVFGDCIEMNPDQSIYMKACGLNWHGSPGESRYCGGNSMWRMSVIAGNGFFDEQVAVGEEPELCYRVRQSGGRILRVDSPMVTHDLGMHRFGQYWRRSIASGKAYASIAMRFRRNVEKMWLREMIINFVEPIAWVAIFLAGWKLVGLSCAFAFLISWWLLRSLQIAFTLRRRRVGFSTAIIYGIHCQFARLPAAIGQLDVLIGAARE